MSFYSSRRQGMNSPYMRTQNTSSKVFQPYKGMISKGMARKRRRQVLSGSTLTPYSSRGATEVKTIDCGQNLMAGTLALPQPAYANCIFAELVLVNHVTGNTGGFTCINGVSNGNGFYNRIGSKITIKSISVKINFVCPVGQNCARVLLIQDKQVNGVVPALTDILGETINDGSHVTNTFLAGINTANRKRFKILKEELLPIVSTNGTQICKIFLKNNIPVDYIAATALATAINSNAIYLICLPLDSTGPSYIFVSQWSTRIRYYDN